MKVHFEGKNKPTQAFFSTGVPGKSEKQQADRHTEFSVIAEPAPLGGSKGAAKGKRTKELCHVYYFRSFSHSFKIYLLSTPVCAGPLLAMGHVGEQGKCSRKPGGQFYVCPGCL